MQNRPQYRVKGAIFENENQNGPAFSGFIEIDGVRTNIVLWPKTSQKGHNYFQVSEDKKRVQNVQNQQPPMMAAPRTFRPRTFTQPTTGPAPKIDMDDDIPF